MVYYRCTRCLHLFSTKCNLVKHLKIKNKCKIKNNDSLLMSEEEIMEISIRKINEYGETIEEEKKYQCELCLKNFTRKDSLNKHKENSCNKKDTIKNTYINTTNNDNSNTVINNITNNNTQNITNNINLNVNLTRGFEEEWDISKIDEDKMMLLLLSDNKYTNTLKEILNNKVNLNVLILDKNSKDIYIYNKDKQKFVQSKKEEILKKSFDKLYNNLNSMVNKLECSNTEYLIEDSPKKIIKESKQKIYDKYNNINSNQEVKKCVFGYITEIFESKKEETQTFHKDLNKIIFQVITTKSLSSIQLKALLIYKTKRFFMATNKKTSVFPANHYSKLYWK